MRIAVLGTGMVGRTLASRLDELGHDVRIGTRDVDASLARRAPTGGDDEEFGDWADRHAAVTVAAFADAAAGAEIVVNATSGQASMTVLSAVGGGNLAGVVLLDVSNPLDFSQGFPPTLAVKDTDSLGEQIQRAFPDARVVKTLNTMTAELMARPRQLADGQHTVFVSGDDSDAKSVATGLLTSMGHTDVIDLGGIATSRGTEMFLPLWLRMMGALGTAMFNIKVVRAP
jgi:predicted dinucleotide-binding enzyme